MTLQCDIYKEFSPDHALLWTMASASKRQCVDLIPTDEVLERFSNDEDSAEGMESGEESDLDRQLENETGESR